MPRKREIYGVFLRMDEPDGELPRRSKRPNIFKVPFACLASMIVGERGESDQEAAYCALAAADSFDILDDEPKYNFAIKGPEANQWNMYCD